MFASQYYQAAPDITCCGKGMSGGYAPLAAILIRDRIAAAFYGEEQDNVQFHHGHTYGGNPIACAAGLAVLNEFLERDILEQRPSAGTAIAPAPGRVGGAVRDYRRGARGGASAGVRIRE